MVSKSATGLAGGSYFGGNLGQRRTILIYKLI